MCELFTVNVHYNNLIFPGVYAVTNSKTTDVYTAIWLEVTELVPEMIANPLFLFGGFDFKTHAAVHQSIHNITQRGSWFHYNQLLMEKWTRLHLAEAPKDILWMSMSLALLPAASFPAGLLIIQAIADNVANDHPTMLEFLVYMRQQWQPRAEIVSAYRCPLRKNSDLEALNAQLKGQLGGSWRNAFVFLEKLNVFSTKQDLDYDRLNLGQNIRRRRRSRSTQGDVHVMQCQDSLDIGRITVEEFLRTAFTFQRRQELEQQMIQLQQDGIRNDEPELVDPNILERNGNAPDLNEIEARLRRQGLVAPQGEENVLEEPELEGLEPREFQVRDPEPVRDEEPRRGRGRPRGRGQPRNVRVPRGRGRPRGRGLPRVLGPDRQMRGRNRDHRPYQVPDFQPQNVNQGVANANDNGRCCICLEEQAIFLLLPCAHLCLCQVCRNRYHDNVCPVCRQIIANTLRVYF